MTPKSSLVDFLNLHGSLGHCQNKALRQIHAQTSHSDQRDPQFASPLVNSKNVPRGHRTSPFLKKVPYELANSNPSQYNRLQPRSQFLPIENALLLRVSLRDSNSRIKQKLSFRLPRALS